MRDPNCLFCKIANKEIPAEIVYEDQNFIAFADINPRSPGHVQVIPKDHYRWVWDLPSGQGQAGVPGNMGDYFRVVQKIALAQKKAFNTEMILSQIIGEDVPHAHIWIFPDPSAKGDKMDFKGNAERIRNFLY